MKTLRFRFLAAIGSAAMLTQPSAAEELVPLVDLYASSVEQMNAIGPDAARAFDTGTKAPSKPDKTQLSGNGAGETAKLVAGEIRKNVPGLAKLLK